MVLKYEIFNDYNQSVFQGKSTLTQHQMDQVMALLQKFQLIKIPEAVWPRIDDHKNEPISGLCVVCGNPLPYCTCEEAS